MTTKEKAVRAVQEAFLADEFFIMTRNAIAQRGNLYREGDDKGSRDAFQRAFRARLESFAQQYRTQVSEDQHLANIGCLASEFSAAHADVLRDGRFRIGSAQKALNLYLKYMWCVARIPMPPHCPFDSKVLEQIPACHNVRWTQLDSLAEYERIVQQAKKQACGVSLPEWELRLFNAARRGGSPDARRPARRSGGELAETRDPKVSQPGGMPQEGDIFRGKVHDKSQYDKDGWRCREISFLKHEISRGQKFDYPIRGNRIVLIDTDGDRYELNFSKPESEHRVCLGTPGRLKPWYQRNRRLGPGGWVYFRYTGQGKEFSILTEEEYRQTYSR